MKSKKVFFSLAACHSHTNVSPCILPPNVCNGKYKTSINRLKRLEEKDESIMTIRSIGMLQQVLIQIT